MSLGLAVAVTAILAVPWIADAERSDTLPPGRWGGVHVELEVTDDGARADFDCAHGELTERLRLDGEGRFSARGTYVEEHPGPAREKEAGAGRPARFDGRVDGDAMTLVVTLRGEDEPVGTFTLARGRNGKLRKCL